MGQPMNVGVVGVGTISGQYFDSFARLPGVRLVALADLDTDRAAAVAAERGVRSEPVERLLADPEVQIVLNLTIPAAHAELHLRAIEAGKHSYGEKPLAVDTAEARRVLDAARRRGVRVGCAPDTVLGTGVQTARKALDDGLIGQPVAAAVHWSSAGHERWHPAPQFYYQAGGGPLLDMAPYYLTSLVTLFGPVVRVSGAATRSSRARTVATGPQAGAPVPVEVDTHVSAILEHAGGVLSTVTVSFEVWATRAPLFEVYGTAGTLAVPDPNQFAEEAQAWTRDTGQWRALQPSAGYRDAGRGYGLADMAYAIATGRPHRASGELAFHTLEIMQAVLDAARTHAVVSIESTVARPEPVPAGARPENW